MGNQLDTIVFIDDLIISPAVGMLRASLATGDNVEYRRAIVDLIQAQCISLGIDWPQVEARILAALDRKVVEG